MVFDVAWLSANEVVWIRLSETLSLDDIAYVMDGVKKLLDEAEITNQIYLLIDAMNLIDYPRDVLQIQKVLRNCFSDNRIAMTLYLSNDYFQKHIIQIIATIFHKRIPTFETYAELVQFLNMPDMTDFPPLS